MTRSCIIKQLCGISDKNITICDLSDEKALNKLDYIPIDGILTYKPKACEACGIKNTSTKDIIKYGFKDTEVRLPDGPGKPIKFTLKKQRFKCKHCEATFIAQSPIVKKFDSISVLAKNKIAVELIETQSMKLVGQRYHVSSNTVVRILRKAADALGPKGNYLPEHLSIDEFKSVKDVSGAMSAILVDSHNKRLIDIIEDRKQQSLIAYFQRYSKKARAAVKTISMDLYSPYLGVVKACFPNAKIVIDRFHIVQLLNNTINSIRIEVMKEIQYSRPTDYRKLKNQWKLILKNADHLDFLNYSYHPLYHAQITEQRMVDYLLSISPKLQQAYQVMNNLKFAIETRDNNYLLATLTELKKVRLNKKVRKTVRTMERFLPHIENALIYRVSNGPTEGMNNKIKLIKRTGYGYASFRNLRARILIQFKLIYKPSNPLSATFQTLVA